MDATRFDRVAKFFADRRLSRREALAKGSAGLAAGALGAAGLRAATAAAQEASPEAEADSLSATGEKTSYLFVQSFQSGSIAPKEGEEGTYTLTLEQGLGQTIYFGDRPNRDVGAVPTGAFLDGLGFWPDNPPNAALVVETEPGETDIAVVELLNPVYDESGPGVTYDVHVLANWQDSLEVGLHEAPVDLADLAPSFGTAHLFIDDCPTNVTVTCCVSGECQDTFHGVDYCWHGQWHWEFWPPSCAPCEPYGHELVTLEQVQDYWDKKCQDAGCQGCKAHNLVWWQP